MVIYFNLPLRRPFALIFNDYPDIDCSNIVEFEIVDTRWNENDYMWTKLLQSIHHYLRFND